MHTIKLIITSIVFLCALVHGCEEGVLLESTDLSHGELMVINVVGADNEQVRVMIGNSLGEEGISLTLFVNDEVRMVISGKADELNVTQYIKALEGDISLYDLDGDGMPDRKTVAKASQVEGYLPSGENYWKKVEYPDNESILKPEKQP